ncbi:HIT family protein [Ramlibacter sp. PS4R-6]|uniref:HIT family protein n=1 Tax=Ramlibacter sp. PS4R-6 TaxID=3133438 RepID=UPI0030AB9BD3
MRAAGCPLCDTAGGHIVFAGDKFRLIRAEEAGFPAFYRVVWNDHVAEFTDLGAADRALCMEAVAQVEALVRQRLKPHKVNLAALGNVVPHLHWHVVARFEWDSHFPAPVWAEARRPPDATGVAQVAEQLPGLDAALCEALGNGRGNCTAA